MILQTLHIALNHIYMYIYMTHVMRKPFCIFENKCAVTTQLIRIFVSLQIQGNSETPRIRDFKPRTIFGCCTARFVSVLVGNPEDRFAHAAAYNQVDCFLAIWTTYLYNAKDHICRDIVSRALQTHNNVVMGVYFDVSMHTTDTNRPVHISWLKPVMSVNEI